MSHALTTNLLDGLFSAATLADLAQMGVNFGNMQFMSESVRFVLVFALLMMGVGRASAQEESMPFRLDLDLTPMPNGDWNLILDLDMDPGDWVVSSYSTDSMFGKVALRFQEPHAVTLLGSIEEMPPSQWEVEPFSQLDIKVIRRDTRMMQRLAMDDHHTEDIHGRVFFVLEPLCTPFETTFTLTPTAMGAWQVVHTGSRPAFPPGHEPRR